MNEADNEQRARGVDGDGDMMQKLLEEGVYQNIEQFNNEEDIESIVKTDIEKQEALLDRFHFHYSGLRI
jgi:hypothetical protein